MALSTEQVWELFCCKLQNYIQKWISDPQIAYDIEQEVYIKIHCNIHTLKNDKMVTAWVLRITKNTVFDYLRKNEIQPQTIDEIEIGHSEFKEHDLDTNKRDLHTEISDGIIEVINDLPFKYKQALTLVELEGVSQKALADSLGISVSAAKSRVQRGRQMIKDRLLACCNYQFDKYGNILGVKPMPCKGKKC